MHRPVLEPGLNDPNPDCTPLAAAELYGVSEKVICDWIDQGLPQSADGLINPFTLCNWLSSDRLGLSPALARRWRMYLRWFEPFVLGMPEQRSITWERRHCMYVPAVVSDVSWWLPAVASDQRQRCIDDSLIGCSLYPLADKAAVWHYQAHGGESIVYHVQGRAEVQTQSVHAADFNDCAELALCHGLARDFLDRFFYGYRRHRRDAQGRLQAQLQPGSCLDAALGYRQLLRQQGLQVELVGGIIAHNSLANPHFWVEVATDCGPMPVDVTLPAIARMLGWQWQEWLDAYVGGCDARRITLGKGEHAIAGFGRSDIGLTTGELLVTDQQGVAFDAWPCIDWVGGECQGIFTH